MKKYILSLVSCAVFAAAIVSCTPEQEVAPIVPPTNNSKASISPRGEYANVQEGDTLFFDVTVDKMVKQAIDFSAVFNENSSADASDIEFISNTLPAYKKSTTIVVVVLADGLAEANEILSFNLNASEDIGYNFQLHPDSDNEVVTVKVSDYDFTLDFSLGTYEGQGMCDLHVDLDIIVSNADVANYDGATGDCPLETGSFASLPDGSYDISVDFYDRGDIPADAGFTIPWIVSISNNSGELYQLEGSFNSDNAGEATAVAGKVEVSNGTFTIYDAAGNELGSI